MVRQAESRRIPLKLSQYVQRRNGVALGAAGSLVNMLHPSLGAGSFAGFWRHWNPIWGNYLGRHINSPLRRFLPAGPALVVTFLLSGAIHDAAVILVSGSIRFLFVPWFGLLGLGVMLSSWIGFDYTSRVWAVRACINVALISSGLGLALLAKRMLGIP